MPKKIVAKKTAKKIANKTAKTVAKKTTKTAKTKIAKKPVERTVAKKFAANKAAPNKAAPRPRAKVLKEPPQSLKVSADDEAGLDLVAQDEAKSRVITRVAHKRSAVDRINDPHHAASDPEGSLVARVSNAIERELSRIEIIVGGSHVPPVLRTEAESRARVLASLARTLKEVMRLREQERDSAEANRADDDAIPRNIDELRSELARRLAILVGDAKSLHPDAVE